SRMSSRTPSSITKVESSSAPVSAASSRSSSPIPTSAHGTPHVEPRHPTEDDALLHQNTGAPLLKRRKILCYKLPTMTEWKQYGYNLLTAIIFIIAWYTFL